MYIDVKQHNKKIHQWTRDEGGTLEYSVHDTPHHLYMRDNTGKGEYKDIHGHRMRRVEFSDRWEMNKFAETRKDVVAESDVQPVYRHLIDNFNDVNTESPLNVSYFDIEVDFDLSEGKGYPTPKNPYGEINAFSIFDSTYDCYLMLIPYHLKKLVKLKDEREGKHVEIVWTKNEKDMLRRFSEYLEHVDITTGWFSSLFDWPYIMERTTILFGEKQAKTMFTRNNIPALRRDFTNDFGDDVWEWSFAGRPHLDMMEMFKKFHPGEMKSFKLDNVCEVELGENKIDYDGDLGVLYRTDPQKFFEYSLHDSRLLKFLDDKRGIISLGMRMVRDMCSLPKDIFGSVNILNMSMMKFARKRDNIVLPDMPMMEKEEFEGAIVFDTLAGRQNWVFTVDVGSMYPNCIMMLGLSKENIVMQLEGGYDDYVEVVRETDRDVSFSIEGEEDTIETLAAYEMFDIIKDNGWTVSGNGTVFDGTMGLIAAYLEEAAKDRQEFKGLMKTVEYGSEEYKMYDQNQLVMKTKMNSMYGVLSQPTFRLADIRLAASTTLTGQLMGKYQAWVANNEVEKLREAVA